VIDEQCLASGDDACRYRVRWQRSARRKLWWGAGAGAGIGLAILVLQLGSGAGGQGIGAAIGFAFASLALGVSLGCVFDLVAQLEAVAGARRGQLALFDQVDDQLAARLDALARADSKLDESSPERPSGSSPSDVGAVTTSGQGSGVLEAAQAIHALAGDLECRIDAQAPSLPPAEAAPAAIGKARSQIREIRQWAAGIVCDLALDGKGRGEVDLGLLVSRAIASVRPQLSGKVDFEVECEANLASVACEPVQIEQALVQLLRNAVEASQGLAQTPEVRIQLSGTQGGVEIAIEDRGTGIDSTEVDEVFDPFFAEAPAGVTTGFGLPICLRIVQAHGGELRIESGDRPGTRVSVLLPRDGTRVESGGDR
jgi:anti-sigma regulatory factor (Ser/Thr protein kinase)